MRTPVRAIVIGMAACSAAAAFARASDPVQSGEAPAADRTARPAGPFASAAHAALDAGDSQKALDLLDAEQVRLPKAERHSLAGRACLALGLHVRARRELATAVDMRPEYADDHYWLGRALAAGDSPALAESHFEQAHWRGLDKEDLHYHWAMALRRCGQLIGRIQQHALPRGEQGPVEPGRFVHGGVVLGPVPNRATRVIVCPPRSAVFRIHKALELAPDDGEVLLLAAEIWAEADRPAQARRLFEKAAARLDGPELRRCRLAWAECLLKSGDLDGYLTQSRAALLFDGPLDAAEMAACYDRAAKAAATRGELARQIRYLTLAVEHRPAVPRLLELSDALLQAGRPADAHSYLELVQDRSPSRKQKHRADELMRRATFLAAPR